VSNTNNNLDTSAQQPYLKVDDIVWPATITIWNCRSGIIKINHDNKVTEVLF